jgi:hypothetical protein
MAHIARMAKPKLRKRLVVRIATPLINGRPSRSAHDSRMSALAAPDAVTELPELTADMTRTDLIEVLEHLPCRRGELCTVRLDRGVRDYLLRIQRAISRRARG